MFLLSACQTPVVPPDNWPPNGPDTTSHEFVFQLDTIGVQGVLYDVAIVNDTLAYAVGEIYLNDSTGQIDPQSYSLAIWNGVNWTPKRLYDAGNQLIPVIRGIFAFSESDVWLADGGVHRWNGVSQQASESYSRIDLIGGVENGQSVDKLWGASSMDIFGVGRIGMVTYFNGSSWQKIESGTTLTLRDVWGGNGVPLTVGTDFASDHRILAITSLGAKDTLGWSENSGPTGVWFKDSSIYVVSNGVYKYSVGIWSQVVPNNALSHISGTAHNNIVAAGFPGKLIHYNGSTWQRFPETEIAALVLRSVDCQSQVIIAVGDVVDVPVVVIGFRR